MSDKQRRILELREAIALTQSMIDQWNVNYEFYQKKIAEWERELKELESE